MKNFMQKIYCYVDETGQDTKGEFFLVSVVVTAKDRDELKQKLAEIETQSGKGKRKWYKTNHKRRVKYIEKIITTNLLKKKIFYSQYSQERSKYIDLTIYTVAKAITNKYKSNYQAVILVDALSRSERRKFSGGLKRLGIKISKVRGARDESDILIRLADAICGFTRDYLEGKKYAKELYQMAVKRDIIKEI